MDGKNLRARIIKPLTQQLLGGLFQYGMQAEQRCGPTDYRFLLGGAFQRGAEGSAHMWPIEQWLESFASGAVNTRT